MGQVNALLVLNGNDLRIRILADAQHAKEIIGQHQSELREALQKTGLTIAALNIENE